MAIVESKIRKFLNFCAFEMSSCASM
jgi:hypothetical protein